MSVLLARLPLQLVCQLIVPGVAAVNDTSFGNALTVDQALSRIVPDDYVAYHEIGTAYKIYNESVGWKVARKRCIAEGAQLALIDSIEKLRHVKSQRGYNGRLTHVGIHSFFDDNEWVSVANGKAVASVPWENGEPYGPYKCVMMKPDHSGLSNDGCEVPGNFVCEVPIPKY